MKSASKRLALSLATATCAACVFGIAMAQSPPSRTDAQRPQLPMVIADMQTRLHERAIGMDSNRDGYIAAEELQAFRAARRDERTQRRMQRLDANRDGRVSTVEFEAAHLARLERADANRDGQITRDEVRVLRSQRRAERLERRARTVRDPNA